MYEKTGIQMYEKNMQVEMFLGRSHDCGYCIGSFFVEQWVGIELPILWLLNDHTRHCTTANPNTNVKMYEKKPAYKCMTKTHTNVWQKPAYKCMTKTRIQMYEKKTHKNVWKKTGIQMYEKNMHTNTHTNVWKKQAYTRMKKTGIQMYEKKQALFTPWKQHVKIQGYQQEGTPFKRSLRACIRETGLLLLGSWRHFTSHPKRFFSFKKFCVAPFS